MRFIAALGALSAIAFSGAQTYTPLFNAVDVEASFKDVTTDGSRNIYLAGESNGQLIARRMNENGTVAWTTIFADTAAVGVDRIVLDADGNVYIAARTGAVNPREFLLTSLDRTNGTIRWTKRVSGIDEISFQGVATAKVGNSILVYAVTTLKLSATNSDVLALRVNPANGNEIWRSQINLGGGATRDFGVRVQTNSNGAPIFLARRDPSNGIQMSVIRLSGTDGSTVFRRDFPGLGSGQDSMQVLTGNNNVALSGNNGSQITPTTVALINGATGAVIASEDVAGFDVGGRSTKFGAYLAPRNSNGNPFILRMDGVTGRFAQQTLPNNASKIMGIDGADQIHYSVNNLSLNGRVERAPSGTFGEPGFTPLAGTVDNKNNLILIGRDSALNHVAKFSQGMAVKSDTFNQPFGASLSIPAPGVLANDFAPAAVLAVTAAPLNGTVTLSQNGAFVYTPNPGNDNDLFTYSATLNGVTRSATVSVRRNAFTSLTAVKSTVIGSEPVTVFANFSFVPSLAGAITVTDNSPSVSGPAVLSINTLGTSTSVRFTTAVVLANQTATVTATAFGTTNSLALTLKPGGLGDFSIGGSGSLISGQSAIGRVELTAPAPGGGQTVALTKISGEATLPSQVTVPSGSTFAIFTINTPQSFTGSSLQVRASLFGGVRNEARQILPMPKVVSVVTPATVFGGDTSVTINLDKVTPYNLPVAIQIVNNTAGVVGPGTITVPTFSDNIAFTLSVPIATQPRTFRVRATAGGATVEQNVVVLPNPLDRVTLAAPAVVGGQATEGTVHLNNLAPAGGVVAKLTSNRPGLITLPASVTVVTGSWSANFQIQTGAVSLTTTASIFAKVATVSKTAVLTLNP